MYYHTKTTKGVHHMTKKIYVIHENNEWTIHLQKRLEELNLPYELWHLDEGTVNLQETPPEGIFYNRMSASSHTRDHPKPIRQRSLQSADTKKHQSDRTLHARRTIPMFR